MGTTYLVRRGENELSVEILEDLGDRVRVRLGDEERVVHVRQLPDGHLAVEGQAGRKLFRTFEDRGRLVVAAGPTAHPFEVVDARTQWLRGAGGGKGAAGGRITASMPGRVVRVPVAVGDVVPDGGVVVVLEAMKMENDVRAPGGGKVAHVAVQVGATVETGALLVQLEAAE